MRHWWMSLMYVQAPLMSPHFPRKIPIACADQLSFAGNPHPRRSHRSRVPLPTSRSGCTQRSENAGKANYLHRVLAVLLSPDPRVRALPPAEFHSCCRHPRVLDLDWGERRPISALEVFQAEGAYEEREECGDNAAEVEVYLVCVVVSNAIFGYESADIGGLGSEQ